MSSATPGLQAPGAARTPRRESHLVPAVVFCPYGPKSARQEEERQDRASLLLPNLLFLTGLFRRTQQWPGTPSVQRPSRASVTASLPGHQGARQQDCVQTREL